MSNGKFVIEVNHNSIKGDKIVDAADEIAWRYISPHLFEFQKIRENKMKELIEETELELLESLNKKYNKDHTP